MNNVIQKYEEIKQIFKIRTLSRETNVFYRFYKYVIK